MKEFGGLGIPDLRELNMCLLASWVQRFYNPELRIWKEIMNCKYHLENPNILCCRDRNASPFLKGFLWAAQAPKMGYRWKYGNGWRIRFWEDQWLGTCSLAIQFWVIYMKKAFL
jgi:hypothetical protein